MSATPSTPARGTNAPNPQGFPSHKQLLLPLMTVLDRAGGVMRPLDAIAAVADYLGIPPAMRDMAVPSGRGKWEGRKRYVFKNRLMWTRLEAVERKYIDKTCRGRWKLTDKAREDLVNVRPGFVFKVYETPNGTALWATAEAAAGIVSNESVNLVFTSPEYALVRAKKYGNIRGADFVQWLVNHGARMPYKLADFILRLTTRPGDVVWDPFCGSNIVGYAAEQLGRRWLAGDISLTYAAGSALRFPAESVAFEDLGYDALAAVGE